jgi:hypothetical protein
MEFIEKKIDGNLLVDTNETDDIDYNKQYLLNKNTVSQNKLTDIFNIRGPSCGLIVVDNFYNNAQNTRDYILTQEFSVKGRHDLCVALRAPVIVEAVTTIALVDFMLIAQKVGKVI